MSDKKLKAGWIGLGRMGFPMAERLIKAGFDVSVWNRTKSKAEPLTEKGAKLVDRPNDLAGVDILFTMVSTGYDLEEVYFGPNGVAAVAGTAPRIFVDCSSIGVEQSVAIRERIEALGSQFLVAPVSGNGKCVKAGKLSQVASGKPDVFDKVKPFLEAIAGNGVAYVGEGDLARICKIAHNVLLGVVTQNLAEMTVLSERAGVPRHAFLEFVNNSVMGSIFTRYKTPALVNLDWTTTFTVALLRKDMDLGLAAARGQNVPMPVAVAAREAIQALIGNGYLDEDFARLITLQARNSGLELKPENVAVEDGLSGR